MAFLKHIGKHGDRKVAIVFKTVPNEEHMCLVIYPETLQSAWHDTIMKVLESPAGQEAAELADILHRNLLPDGRNILETLHMERMLKRVRTDQIVVTPTPQSSVRLDELNRMLQEMKDPAMAQKRAAEHANRGMVDAPTKRAAESAFKSGQMPPVQGSPDALSDQDIAGNMLSQAKRMENEARGLINEAARMKKEAERLFPNAKAKDTPTTVISESPPKKTRGRPPKVLAAHEAQ
jgi:hypothetical protein